jgi:hypothetical protein
MHPKKKSPATGKDSSANLGFEAKLWLAADKLRNNMDTAANKHQVNNLNPVEAMEPTCRDSQTC